MPTIFPTWELILSGMLALGACIAYLMTGKYGSAKERKVAGNVALLFSAVLLLWSFFIVLSS